MTKKQLKQLIDLAGTLYYKECRTELKKIACARTTSRFIVVSDDYRTSDRLQQLLTRPCVVHYLCDNTADIELKTSLA